MARRKDPRVREQELLDELAQVTGDLVRQDAAFVKDIQEGLAAAERGEGVPWREVAAEWRKRRGSAGNGAGEG